MAEEVRQESKVLTGQAGAPACPVNDPPVNPEVVVANQPRRYTADYKLRVLAVTDQCQMHGDVGLFLRQEGLYHSTLRRWRRWRQRFQAQGVTMRISKDFREENARLLRENKRLELKLKKAEALIALQKKVSELMTAHQDEANEGTSL